MSTVNTGRTPTSTTLRWGLAATLSVLVLPGAVHAQEGAELVTFSRDVAPILQQNCQVCHTDGSIAPMSLITYRDTRRWASRIKERVSDRLMPPWHLNPQLGIQEFKNDRSLSEEEIATIVKWVDAGAPEGDPADMPPPVSRDDFERHQRNFLLVTFGQCRR